MVYIPILGRLSLSDYARLFLAFLVLLLEPVFRFVFAIAPPLKWLVEKLRTQLTWFYAPKDVLDHKTDAEQWECDFQEASLHHLRTTEDFIKHWGFPFQPHFLTTDDGYILALHRIPFSRAENERRGLSFSREKYHKSVDLSTWANRPVVLLWHGFLMCSEVWVSTPDPIESLAFTLADAGYDVWCMKINEGLEILEGTNTAANTGNLNHHRKNFGIFQLMS